MQVAEEREEPRCQIVRTLDIVGEKWALLIVRNALRGQTKFSEFRDSLGAPSDILTARLGTLVTAGILEKRAYREPGSRERSSYHLTESGLGMRLILGAMVQWGDEFNPSQYGRSSLLVERATRDRLEVSFVTEDGERRAGDEVAITPGPASLVSW
jgi:DNA-binding HxlR family transcriptional regulator